MGGKAPQHFATTAPRSGFSRNSGNMVRSVVSTASPATVVGSRHAHQFQPEIQGMRALSVLAVVCAHAGLPGLRGGFTGVDVFFVISGFLITRLLLSETATTGRIDLFGFWARRVRRLLPNAYAALAATALIALFLMPAYNLGALAREITFAGLQIVNFYFADQAVDYFQADAHLFASPDDPTRNFAAVGD
jgi:peptidoglycan/LPS O-acetylase OafA/YrhL